MLVLALVLAMILLLWAAVLLVFGRPLWARWREPVLIRPVLIIESDDWGAGPLAQADALKRLAGLLQGIRDSSNHPAVMTLGVILEVPDGPRMAASGATQYHGLPLTAPTFDTVREAIYSGIAAGVFSPQLHGQCHYWPPALMTAATTDVTVRNWLASADPATTENLPSVLQSRWVDASTLPSHALAPEVIQQAVVEEAACFQQVFGHAPKVAVATTFVWNDEVESAWAQAGVDVVITPGRRATCRDAMGTPACEDGVSLSGEHSLAGQTYLVRDVYFEPALGHLPQRLLDGLLMRQRQGRACLVETHRFNFMQHPEAGYAVLESALKSALQACPELRFMAPLQLAQAIKARDPLWTETRFKPRLAAWLARLDEIPRFRRVARLTGLALPLAWLECLQ